MNPFDSESAIAVGAGLVLLGLGFVVIDFFTVRLVKRLHPHQSTLAAPPLLRAVLTHRIRFGGIMVGGGGLFILAMTMLTNSLQTEMRTTGCTTISNRADAV
jgi:hypothetical protein